MIYDIYSAVQPLVYRPLRLNSQDTPRAGRILDLDGGSMTSVVSRLSGHGQVSVKVVSGVCFFLQIFLAQLPMESTRVDNVDDDSVFEEATQVFISCQICIVNSISGSYCSTNKGWSVHQIYADSTSRICVSFHNFFKSLLIFLNVICTGQEMKIPRSAYHLRDMWPEGGWLDQPASIVPNVSLKCCLLLLLLTWLLFTD